MPIIQRHFRKAILYFLSAYVMVTILAYGISYAAALVFKLPSYQELGVGLFQDPAFVMTVPYHLLINLAVWTLFSYLYLKNQVTNEYFFRKAVDLAVLWLALAMIVDLVCFVLIKSPVSLTVRQFYVEYQPWISITYIIVFASPLISYLIWKRRLSQR